MKTQAFELLEELKPHGTAKAQCRQWDLSLDKFVASSETIEVCDDLRIGYAGSIGVRGVAIERNGRWCVTDLEVQAE